MCRGNKPCILRNESKNEALYLKSFDLSALLKSRLFKMIQRSANYQPWFFYYCLFALFWVTLLLFAGGFTTTIRAGMAFLDWPLSNGSINPDGWITETDKLAEHSHRLLGMKVGLIAIGLWVWAWLRQERKSVHLLTLSLLSMIVLQGLMGGAGYGLTGSIHMQTTIWSRRLLP